MRILDVINTINMTIQGVPEARIANLLNVAEEEVKETQESEAGKAIESHIFQAVTEEIAKHIARLLISTIEQHEIPQTDIEE